MTSPQTKPNRPLGSEQRWPVGLFAAIVLAYLVYAAAFIYRTSFVVDGTRYFCLQDDAMIAMCYARNAAHGQGLVWTPGGERVEGYTNPLWLFYMAVLHVLPVPASKISLLVQMSGAACLAWNLLYVKKIAEFLAPEATLAWVGAVLLTAFYLPLNNWAIQGMEVGVLTLFVSLAVWTSLKSICSGEFPWLLYVLMGLSLLVRIDMLVPCVIISAYLALVDANRRWRHGLVAIAVLGLSLALQTAFRLWYFGDLLPNTYYLKMTGYPALLRIARGLLVLLDFVGYFNWILFLLPLVLLIIRPDKWIALPIAVFAGQVAYSVYTGGDCWEWWGGSNRFLSLAMPLHFILLCCALDAVLRCLEAGGLAQLRPPWLWVRRAWRPCTMAFLLLVTLLNTNALRGARSWVYWRLEEPPLHVRDNQRMVQRARIIEQTTAPDAKVAVQWAGIVPYFANRPVIDLLGKNDRYIAHLPMHRGPGLRWFFPGHLKWDLEYSMGRLRPDVVEQPWIRTDQELKPWLADFDELDIDGVVLYLRKDSDRVLSAPLTRVRQSSPEANTADSLQIQP
jgi:hypothetical protein